MEDSGHATHWLDVNENIQCADPGIAQQCFHNAYIVRLLECEAGFMSRGKQAISILFSQVCDVSKNGLRNIA